MSQSSSTVVIVASPKTLGLSPKVTTIEVLLRTVKTSLAVSIARACIWTGRRGRLFNVVGLVNKLEAENHAERRCRTAGFIYRHDFLIPDELG